MYKKLDMLDRRLNLRFDDNKIIEMREESYTWKEIAAYFNTTIDKLMYYVRNRSWYHEVKGIRGGSRGKKETMINTMSAPKVENIDKKTRLADGSISSSILKRLSDKKPFTDEELLEEHGLDPTVFRIKHVISNEWSVTNAEGHKYYNFQSKITAELIDASNIPLAEIEKILQNLQPWDITKRYHKLRKNNKTYLLIPLFDLHFGTNSMEYYGDMLAEICQIIEKGAYDEILIIVGGDYLDVDSFNNTTARGTVLETVDYPKMINDAELFLLTLCKHAVEYSPKVELTYLPGNHAPSNDYMLVRAISKLLPDVVSNIELDEYKHNWLGPHAIFTHHGDKRNKTQQLLEIIVSNYTEEWGKAKSRYLITGHFHHEKSLSTAGLTHYQAMSPSQSTSYERKNGFTTSERGLMLFEFNDVKRKKIIFI